MKRILLSLLLPLLGIAPLAADAIRGRVVDAKSKLPLSDVIIEAEAKLDFCTMVIRENTDSLGHFLISDVLESRSRLAFNLLGYHPLTKHLTVFNNSDTLDLGDIELQPSDVWLNEAVVKAHAKRFTMHGDTVVFNPEAFHLKDDARLEDLIAKLPGVTMKDGALYWQNRPVRFRMNGTQGVGNALLLSKLPAAAVKNIKAYDETSELTDRTGIDDGKSEQVLDITIKEGWLDKWYGDIKAQAYAKPHYEAEMNAFRLSTYAPFMFFGRIADNDRKYTAHTFDSWSKQRGNYYKQQMLSLGMSRKKKSRFSKRENQWTLSSSLNNTEDRIESSTHTSTFMPGTKPTFSTTHREETPHRLSIPLNFYANYHLDSLHTLSAIFDLEVEKTRNEQAETSSTYTGNPFNDASAPLLNTGKYAALSESTTFSSVAKINFTRFIEKGQFIANVNARFSTTKEDFHSLGRYTYHSLGVAPRQDDKQYFHSPQHSAEAKAHLRFNRWLTRHWQIDTGYDFSYQHDQRTDDRYRWDLSTFATTAPELRFGWLPDLPSLLQAARDHANSWQQTTDLVHHRASVGTTLNLGRIILTPHLRLAHRYEKTDYRRGKLDTLVRRNDWLPSPSFEAVWKFNKRASLRLNTEYNRTLPELLDAIAYTDNTRPLYIVEGNPALRPSAEYSTDAIFSLLVPRGSQAFSLAVGYTRRINPIITVVRYDTRTGGYRVHKENFQDGQSWNGKLGYDRAMGDYFRFTNDLHLSRTVDHGLLPLIDTDPTRRVTRQRLFSLTEKPAFHFEKNQWKVSLEGSWLYRNAHNTQSSPAAFVTHSYSAKLSGKYLPDPWEVEASVLFRGNRGYLATEMNRPQTLIDLSISRKILHDKGKLTLTVSDLLDQENIYEGVITATSRTDTWSSNFNRYISLTFTYRLDAKGKK